MSKDSISSILGVLQQMRAESEKYAQTIRWLNEEEARMRQLQERFPSMFGPLEVSKSKPNVRVDPLDPLNAANPKHSRELAAAIACWRALVSDQTLTQKRTPKQAATKWLTDKRKAFGLSSSAIERIVLIVNFDRKGGVRKRAAK